MSALEPLQTLFSAAAGDNVPLTPELARLYGSLSFPFDMSRPLIAGNFVSTLDGVISFGLPGRAGGRPISGASPHDRLVMGLLRAVADTVIVSAGSFRSSSTRRWTADAAYPPLARDFARLRRDLGKTEPPMTVVVTASGDLGSGWAATVSADNPVLVLTTPEGARRLHASPLPSTARVRIAGSGRLTAAQVLAAAGGERPGGFVLVEAGPKLMGDFVRERRLDELFLTVAPQIAGRDDHARRPGFVAGALFGPDNPRWGELVDVKRTGSHLFLRYSFDWNAAALALARRLGVLAPA
jgi:riboflavin biosynthesis pyrimidine reductase